jgi:hypothetical protein
VQQIGLCWQPYWSLRPLYTDGVPHHLLSGQCKRRVTSTFRAVRHSGNPARSLGSSGYRRRCGLAIPAYATILVDLRLAPPLTSWWVRSFVSLPRLPRHTKTVNCPFAAAALISAHEICLICPVSYSLRVVATLEKRAFTSQARGVCCAG